MKELTNLKRVKNNIKQYQDNNSNNNKILINQDLNNCLNNHNSNQEI